MSFPAIRRPTLVALPVVAVAVLVAGAYLVGHYGHDPVKGFAAAAFTVVALVSVFALPYIEPIYPVLAGIALSVFSGNWTHMGVPVGLDRPLLIYGLAAVVIQSLPDQRRFSWSPMTPLRWSLLALGVYGVGSALFADTLAQKEPLFGLIDQFGLLGFTLFILGPTLFLERRHRDFLLATLIGLGAYLSWDAFFEGVHLHALVVPHYVNNPALGIHSGRARGPMLEAAANGLSLYTCGVAAAMGMIRWWHRTTIRLACQAILALSLLGVVFTLTREVWLGSAVATIVTMLLEPRLRRFLLPAVALAVVLIVGALAYVPGLNADASSRASTSRSVWDRLNSDSAALRMIDERPLLGFGWFRFGTDSAPYYRQSASYPLTTVGEVHNVFLGTAVGLGLVGLVWWLTVLITAIVSAIRRRGPPEVELWRVGLIAVALNWLIVANFTPLGYALPNHLIWLWPGVVLAGLREARGQALGRAAGPAL